MLSRNWIKITAGRLVIVATVLAAGGALLLLGGGAASSTTTPVLRLDPSTIKVQGPAGNSFTMDVVIEGATDLGAFEFQILFDEDFFSVSDVRIGPFLGSTGRTVTCQTIFIGDNVVQVGCSTTGSEAGPDGFGVLASVDFTVGQLLGPTFINLRNCNAADTTGETIVNNQCKDTNVTINPPGTPATPTATETPLTPTPTPTATETPETPTATPTATETPETPTATPTATETPETPTATPTATETPETATATPTATETPETPTATPTATETPVTPTATETPATATATPTSPPTTSTPASTATPPASPEPTMTSEVQESLQTPGPGLPTAGVGASGSGAPPYVSLAAVAAAAGMLLLWSGLLRSRNRTR